MTRARRPCCSLFVIVSLLLGAAVMGLLSDNVCQAGTFEANSSREIRLIRARVRAAQFLSKATFGPTKESIETLAIRINQVGYRRACEQWIDKQIALPATSHEQVAYDIIKQDGNTPTQITGGVFLYRYQVWWHIALTSEDQLRQRVAWALAQIFVIGNTGGMFNGVFDRSIGLNNGVDERSIPDWLGMSNYYDMLADNSFGNYRELLGDVTFHPNMGVYLSSHGNRKSDISLGRFPDENFAREVMQLFSVGLYELRQDGRLKVNAQGELIPTYDNEGIKDLARVFTGFKYKHNTNQDFNVGRNMGQPMVLHAGEHDSNYDYAEDPNNPGQSDPNAPASKTVFGVTLPPLPFPVTDEAATSEVNHALDVIAEHDNVAPFICRLLIQRLVRSNPSRAYVNRVTRKFRNNGRGVRGDLKAVVKAILLDPEVTRSQRLLRKRNPHRIEVMPRGTEFSRLREPVLRTTAWIRAMNPTSDYLGGYQFLGDGAGNEIGQLPFRSPSVFNFYLPDYQPPGLVGVTPSRRYPQRHLYAPEFQILTAVTNNRMTNYFHTWARLRYFDSPTRKDRCRLYFDLDEELELAKDLANMPEILRRFDLLLCNGTLSEETKANIITAVTTHTAGADHRYASRVSESLIAVLLSPDCVIEE